MPNPAQIRGFWIKWIDRQYAKADPSHVKMRPEDSGEDPGTRDDTTTGTTKPELPKQLPPVSNGLKH